MSRDFSCIGILKPKKSVMKSEKMFEFHVGRGGRFNNPGFVRYVGEVESITDTSVFQQHLYPPKYKNGNDDYRTLAKEWTLADGRDSGLTNEDVKRGYGSINVDNAFDTTNVVPASKLSTNDIKLIFEDSYFFNSDKLLFVELVGCTENDLNKAIERGEVDYLIEQYKD